MSGNQSFRKYINFDLSTNELKKHFNNTAEAYNKIKEFMTQNGFEHRQYSSYISKEPIDDYDFSQILEIFARKHIWLKDCLQSFDILNVENRIKIDATKQIHNAIQKAERIESQIQKTKEPNSEAYKFKPLRPKIHKKQSKDNGFEP